MSYCKNDFKMAGLNKDPWTNQYIQMNPIKYVYAIYSFEL